VKSSSDASSSAARAFETIARVASFIPILAVTWQRLGLLK
jgi:hypothetical protein